MYVLFILFILFNLFDKKIINGTLFTLIDDKYFLPYNIDMRVLIIDNKRFLRYYMIIYFFTFRYNI